jgi:hypothetical protein
MKSTLSTASAIVAMLEIYQHGISSCFVRREAFAMNPGLSFMVNLKR